MLDLPINNIGTLPGLELQIIQDKILLFLFCSIRISAFLISSPIFGAGYVLLPVRILFAMVLTLSIFQDQSALIDVEKITSSIGIILIAKEIAIGLSAGLVLTIWFSAASLAGEKIAASTGLSFAGLIDPESGTQTPVISQILSLFMIVVFLSLDGHLLALSVILESYKVLPIGATNINMSMIQLGIDAGGLMFKFGALIMLPIIVGITLLNVVIGIVTRSAPTLNLFSFGFPITMLFAFFLLYVCTITIGSNFSNISNVSVDFIHRLIEGLM